MVTPPIMTFPFRRIMHAHGVFAVATTTSQNLVISLSSKQLNPKLRVVARCHDVKNVEKTRRAGRTRSCRRTVYRRLAHRVEPMVGVTHCECPSSPTMLKSEANLRMEEIVVTSGFSGKSFHAVFALK